ncbi:hypothetical protein PTKIN_Ptkin18bG0072800 [Pterospermum kingtungense]
MDSNIRVISTSMVQAENYHDEQPQNIDLTPWDLQFLLAEYSQRGLIYQIPQVPEVYDQDEQVGNIVVFYMKMFLSSTLHYFPPLAGRLSAMEHDDGDTVSFSITCNNSGALFIHAVADGVTTSDIMQPVYIPSVLVSFFTLINGVKNYEGTSNLLLAVQVTELVDGFFISVSVNHSMVDGASFFPFLQILVTNRLRPYSVIQTTCFPPRFFQGSYQLPHSPSSLLLSSKL